MLTIGGHPYPPAMSAYFITVVTSYFIVLDLSLLTVSGIITVTNQTYACVLLNILSFEFNKRYCLKNLIFVKKLYLFDFFNRFFVRTYKT